MIGDISACNSYVTLLLFPYSVHCLSSSFGTLFHNFETNHNKLSKSCEVPKGVGNYKNYFSTRDRCLHNGIICSMKKVQVS